MNPTAEQELIAVETASETISHEPFYLSAEFFVGVAFVVVVAFLCSPIKKAAGSLIFKRITRIKNEFQEAENLKLEAQKLYAEYERKLLNKDNEIAEIISEEENLIAETKAAKVKELDLFMRQKQAEADDRIDMALEQANIEINNAIADRAVNILKNVLAVNMTPKEYNRLIDNSINNLKKMPLE